METLSRPDRWGYGLPEPPPLDCQKYECLATPVLVLRAEMPLEARCATFTRSEEGLVKMPPVKSTPTGGDIFCLAMDAMVTMIARKLPSGRTDPTRMRRKGSCGVQARGGSSGSAFSDPDARISQQGRHFQCILLLSILSA